CRLEDADYEGHSLAMLRRIASGSAQIVLPADLLQEIDELVGIGARTEFITGLTRREVHRLRLLRFLGEKSPGWDLEKHLELKDGAAQWVESIRRDEEPTNGETHRSEERRVGKEGRSRWS